MLKKISNNIGKNKKIYLLTVHQVIKIRTLKKQILKKTKLTNNNSKIQIQVKRIQKFLTIIMIIMQIFKLKKKVTVKKKPKKKIFKMHIFMQLIQEFQDKYLLYSLKR